MARGKYNPSGNNVEGPNKPGSSNSKNKDSGKYAYRDQSKNVPNPGNIGAINEWNKGEHSTKD